jgi:saccharopine dehydrogenase (NADP+, L-glutamate forming)/spermidine synthase
MKRVLVLGAGMVARPLVARLLMREDLKVTVADVDAARAALLVSGSSRADSVALDARDQAAVGDLLEQCDLLVSILPWELEPDVTRLAVAKRRNMVSASVRGEAGMDRLADEAKAAGVTLLPEVGLDPGLDHMAISRIVARVRDRGGTVVSVKSYCGGLPAPDADTNCWDYKFSWNPMGAVEASLLDARYLREGREVTVPNDELFARHWPLRIPGFDELEAHFSGDSLPYADIYGLDSLYDLLRATLRYPGWAFTMSGIQRLGYNSTESLPDPPATYAALTRRLAGLSTEEELVAGLARALDVDVQSSLVERLMWLGLASDDPIQWPQDRPRTPLAALAARMFEKMMFAPGERDLSIMHNEIEAEYPSGVRERSTATLIAYGDPKGDSSMAFTVGTPAAIAATLILDGRIPETGLVLPVKPHIFVPILDEMAALGCAFDERTEVVSPGERSRELGVTP